MFVSGCLLMDFRSDMMPAWYQIFYSHLTLCNLSAWDSLALVLTLSSQCQSHLHRRWNWSERFKWKGLLQASLHFVRITSHGLLRRKRKSFLLGAGLIISFEFSTHEISKNIYSHSLNEVTCLTCLENDTVKQELTNPEQGFQYQKLSAVYFHILGMLYSSIFTLTY